MAKSNFFSPEIALSSKKNDWTTPINLFDILNNEFHFTVDLCASAENALCNKFYCIENSGLNAQFSREIVFCNPPYGRKITSDFIKKCYELSFMDNIVVMLIPARTDTKAFHEYIWNKAEIRFIKGRLRFGNSENPAPFPSMIVVFRGKKDGKE